MPKIDDAPRAGGRSGMRLWWLAAATGIAVGVSALPVASCSSPTGDRLLLLKFSKNQIDADGKDSAEVFVEAVEADGKTAGTGLVLLTTDRGHFNGEAGLINTSVTLEGGAAKVTYSCDESLEPDCSGKPSIEASWKGALAKSGSKLGVVPSGSAGPDGGTIIPGRLVMSPDKVYLFGTYITSSCNDTAVVDPDEPTVAAIGFPCYTGKVALDGLGHIVYIDSGASNTKFLRLEPDEFEWVSGCREYPQEPAKNDQLILSDLCGSDGRIIGRPDSSKVYCYSYRKSAYVDESGEPVPLLDQASNLEPIDAIGRTGVALHGEALLDANGKLIKIVDLAGSVKYARAYGNGFRAIVTSGATGYARWLISDDGTATKEGEFATSSTYKNARPSILSGDGIGYTVSSSGAGDVVLKFPLQPGSAEVVYDSNKAPIPDFCNASFAPWVVPGNFSQLITGP
ncbi:MAG: hypothetical protein QM765_21870 [Myxococcales bacterium]